MYKKIISITICLFVNLWLFAGNFTGTPLQTGSSDNIGWMCPEGINTKIIGVVKTTGDFPDIFVQSDTLYAGIFSYKYINRDANGTPVFGNKTSITVPFDTKTVFNVGIYQMPDNSINMVWLSGDKIHKALFNTSTNTFTENASYSFPTFAYYPTSLSSFVDDSQKLNIIVSIPSTVTTLPPGDPKASDYIPFMLTGVWRGKLGSEQLYKIVYNSLSDTPNSTQLLSPAGSEILMGVPGSSSINISGSNLKGDIIAGNYYGTLYYFEKNSDSSYKRVEAINLHGDFIRNPTMFVAPVAYTNESGVKCDILAAGRGGIFFYKYTGAKDVAGKPIYNDPVPVLEKNVNLYGGSMPVPTVVDVDGDGVLDIVSGNAEGYILLFKNTGTNQNPIFQNPQYLKSNNKMIHIEPGYSENPSGPIGARLGYLGPNVIDWDGDGVVDLIMNDARGKHTFYKGQLTNGELSFQREKLIYFYGLELRGTQRCRPGVGLFNGKMAYITLDDDDEFHLYWKVDNQNLEEGGKLKLENGSTIDANNLYSLGTGRIRIELADWDNDGKKDLILGVDKWHCVPNVTTGLPAKGTNPSATVLFMKNTGTEAAPKFALPVVVTYQGTAIQAGDNACGVSVAWLGTIINNLPNLLMTDERGRYYIVNR